MSKVLIALGAVFALSLSPAMGTMQLENGGMEGDSFSVAPGWTYYSGGSITGASQSRNTTTVHGGVSSQRLAGSAANSSGNFGIQQTVDANIGDAFTIGGWVWPDSAGTYNETSIRAAWDGGTSAATASVLASWLPSGTQKQKWHEMALAAGNATATSVTVFLHSRRYSSNGSLLTYWDDVTAYHAFVPPAPSVSSYTGISAGIDINPGDNQTAAQYAISITGGAFGSTEGVYWVHPTGLITTAKVFLTDAQWGVQTITGLENGTAYTAKVLARYDGYKTQETYFGEGVIIPEPSVVALFAAGSLMLLRRRQ